MAKGREEHRQRQQDIQRFGKDLARRAKRVCELCEAKESLSIVDSNPDLEPDMDTLILLCVRCQGLIQSVDGDARTLRFLEQSVWSEVSIVANIARQLIAQVDADWARTCVELFSDIE